LQILNPNPNPNPNPKTETLLTLTLKISKPNPQILLTQHFFRNFFLFEKKFAFIKFYFSIFFKNNFSKKSYLFKKLSKHSIFKKKFEKKFPKKLFFDKNFRT